MLSVDEKITSSISDIASLRVSFSSADQRRLYLLIKLVL
jgi:hypothetical protein